MTGLSLKNLEDRVGQEIGLSPWLEMTQERINQFAESTGDHQWIHVDIDRASKSPLKSTVAHGYLLLSLLPFLNTQNTILTQKFRMAINYGLNRVRFIYPVRPGDRLRCRSLLKQVEKRGLRKALVTMESTIEIENKKKPALVGEVLALIYL